MRQRITVAHSPDADDAFMFYALAMGKGGDPDLEFVHILRERDPEGPGPQLDAACIPAPA